MCEVFKHEKKRIEIVVPKIKTHRLSLNFKLQHSSTVLTVRAFPKKGNSNRFFLFL